MPFPSRLEDRVLVLAPTGRDAALIGEMLNDEAPCAACATVDELASKVEEGAGMAIFAEEALAGVSIQSLLEALTGQPSWSDFPLLFLTTTGQESPKVSTRLLALFGEQANLTILERPVRVPTLLSSVRSALRARRRQYQVRDYLEEKKLRDEKLLEKQKLESLGVLAGGVAHDFNNLLTGILGNASLAVETLPPDSPAHRMLRDVVDASERAAHLTKQLLAYAGKGRFVVQAMDLSGAVRDVSHLIQSSIPKNADVRLDLAAKLPCIEADSAQIQQLLMNLVINAAEAIPEDRQGRVLVTTRVQDVDENYIEQTLSPGEIVPGEYVALEVHDTGVGMDQTTLQRIFDPFFTTKFTGRGLGLAAAIGIVRGHKGALKVYSTPGQGSTFKILFPTVADGRQPSEVKPAIPVRLGLQRGAVLVIDDEDVVRRTAKATLERGGFDIVLAENGAEGVQLFQTLATKISAVLLDLTMPGMGGEETLRRIQEIRPDAKVVLSSGYNEVEVIRKFAGKGLAGFLQKPYTSAALMDKIQTTLGLRRSL
jgi:signal transduction histidine kinase/CheY-like chemotaxis protein